MLDYVAAAYKRPSRSPITRSEYRLGVEPANKGKKYPVEVLNRDEINRLLAACSRRGSAGLRNQALIIVLWRTGLRIGEALALQVKDVDLEQGLMAVLHGKGDRRRVVGVDPSAAAVLQFWIDRRRELRVPRGSPLFCTITRPGVGGPMSSSYVREAFKDLATKAGIEKRVHPHGFRHTHASEIAGEGVALHVVRRQLGHSNLATTARYIDHLTPHDVIRAIRERPDWATHELPPS